jgi:hypothetical protein
VDPGKMVKIRGIVYLPPSLLPPNVDLLFHCPLRTLTTNGSSFPRYSTRISPSIGNRVVDTAKVCLTSPSLPSFSSCSTLALGRRIYVKGSAHARSTAGDTGGLHP